MLKAEPNPAQFSCFSPVEMSYLAAYKKSCDVCTRDLKDTKGTLGKCIDGGASATRWWADPTFIIGGFAVSLSLGIVAGVLLAK
jgi:hypothetical protein